MHVVLTCPTRLRLVWFPRQDSDYAWLRVQDTFNSVLEDLNAACGTADGTIPTAPPPDSVLESSKTNKKRGSRLRMFESRFRKGKDLSVMGTDDLACILGKSEKRTLGDRLVALSPASLMLVPDSLRVACP